MSNRLANENVGLFYNYLYQTPQVDRIKELMSLSVFFIYKSLKKWDLKFSFLHEQSHVAKR